MTVGDCSKLWILCPPSPHNLELMLRLQDHDERLARGLMEMEHVTIIRTTSSHALWLPEGTIHATITDVGGILVGVNFGVAEGICVSAQCLILDLALEGDKRDRKANIDLYTEVLKEALRHMDSVVHRKALDSWITLTNYIRRKDLSIYFKPAFQVWKSFLEQKGFEMSSVCPCGTEVDNLTQHVLNIHMSK